MARCQTKFTFDTSRAPNATRCVRLKRRSWHSSRHSIALTAGTSGIGTFHQSRLRPRPAGGARSGRSAISKSTKLARIVENFEVFDFELFADQIASIDGLDTGVRGGPDPESITLDTYGREIPEA